MNKAMEVFRQLTFSILIRAAKNTDLYRQIFGGSIKNTEFILSKSESEKTKTRFASRNDFLTVQSNVETFKDATAQSKEISVDSSEIREFVEDEVYVDNLETNPRFGLTSENLEINKIFASARDVILLKEEAKNASSLEIDPHLESEVSQSPTEIKIADAHSLLAAIEKNRMFIKNSDPGVFNTYSSVSQPNECDQHFSNISYLLKKFGAFWDKANFLNASGKDKNFPDMSTWLGVGRLFGKINELVVGFRSNIKTMLHATMIEFNSECEIVETSQQQSNDNLNENISKMKNVDSIQKSSEIQTQCNNLETSTKTLVEESDGNEITGFATIKDFNEVVSGIENCKNTPPLNNSTKIMDYRYSHLAKHPAVGFLKMVTYNQVSQKDFLRNHSPLFSGSVTDTLEDILRRSQPHLISMSPILSETEVKKQNKHIQEKISYAVKDCAPHIAENRDDFDDIEERNRQLSEYDADFGMTNVQFPKLYSTTLQSLVRENLQTQPSTVSEVDRQYECYKANIVANRSYFKNRLKQIRPRSIMENWELLKSYEQYNEMEENEDADKENENVSDFKDEIQAFNEDFDQNDDWNQISDVRKPDTFEGQEAIKSSRNTFFKEKRNALRELIEKFLRGKKEKQNVDDFRKANYQESFAQSEEIDSETIKLQSLMNRPIESKIDFDGMKESWLRYCRNPMQNSRGFQNVEARNIYKLDKRFVPKVQNSLIDEMKEASFKAALEQLNSGKKVDAVHLTEKLTQTATLKRRKPCPPYTIKRDDLNLEDDTIPRMHY